MLTIENLLPTGSYTKAMTFANADTRALEFDVRSTVITDCIMFQTADKIYTWGQERCLRQGFYTIRRRCEYVRFRSIGQTGSSVSDGTVMVNLCMYSAADVPDLADTGALR